MEVGGGGESKLLKSLKLDKAEGGQNWPRATDGSEGVRFDPKTNTFS